MGVVDIGSSWSTGDQPTAAVLNAKWTNSTFNSSAVDGSTTALSGGAIIIKDLGVSTAKIAANAVTAAKMATTQDWSSFTITMPNEVIDSDQYVDGSIDHVHLANDVITGATELSAAPADADDILIYDNSQTDMRKLGIDNLMKHPAIPKAYGVIVQSTDSTTGSYKISSASTSGTGPYLTTVTLGVTMADTDYAVTVTNGSTNDDDHEVVVHTRTTTTFIVETKNQVKLHLAVFGTLA